MSAFTGPAVIMIPIAGVFADRYGRKPVIMFGLLTFGTAGTAIAFTNSFAVALLLRVLQGIGFSALTPILVTVIGDLYTGVKETTAQGVRFMGSGIAQTVFPLIAGILVIRSWQYPFLLYVLAIPIAGVVAKRFEEPERPNSSPIALRRTPYLYTQVQNLVSFLSKPNAAAMLLARAMPGVGWIAFLTYNSILVKEVIGGTAAHAGVLAALGSLSYAVASTQAGRVIEQTSRLYSLISLNIFLAVGISILFTAQSIKLFYVGVIMLGIGFGLLITLYRSMITEMAPPSLLGSWVSLTEAVGRLTFTLTPILMGIAIAYATPRFGFIPSLKLVGVTTGFLASGIGILSILVVSNTQSIEAEA